MSKTEESLIVLDLLEAGKIDVSEAETLISAMQPQRGHGGVIIDLRAPDAISVMVDGNQADLGRVMEKLSAAFETVACDEVN